MEIKKPRIEDQRIRKILHALGEEKTYDFIEGEAPCRRSSISAVKKWYNSLPWGEAVVFAEGDEIILKKRSDYLKEKAQEVHKIDDQLKPHFDEPALTVGLDRANQQITHIHSLQELAREFLDSLKYPTDIHNFEDVKQSHESYWRAFKRLLGDARWDALDSHLGYVEDDFINMENQLEPIDIRERRKNPDKIIVTLHSIQDSLKVIGEANELISNSGIYNIAEECDTEEWERCGLLRWCAWCVH